MPDAPLMGIYPGPDLDSVADEALLRERAQAVYRESFGADPRFAVLSTRVDELALRANESSTPALVLLMRQLELGRRLYRAGDILDAIDALEQAMNDPSRTLLQWADPDLLAESLEVLALAYQEAQVDGLMDDELLDARLRAALREWIRVMPGHRMDERRYPMSFVEAWRDAYFDQLETSAALLAIRIEEAREASSLLGVDLLVDLRLLRGALGSSVSVRVYDAVEDRFAFDALLAWDGSPDGLADVLSRSFSSVAACIPLRAPMVETEPRRAVESVWLSGAWAAFAYVDRPTERAFLNQGIEAIGQLYFSPVVGIYLDGVVSFSSRDRHGTLLRPVQTQSLSLGMSFKYERTRFRLFLDGGIEIGRRSSVAVTRDFWCRVSGGEVTDFGPDRACEASNVTRRRGSASFGLKFRGGASFRVAGDVWLYASIFASLGVAPFEGRVLDRPIGGSAGASYRF